MQTTFCFHKHLPATYQQDQQEELEVGSQPSSMAAEQGKVTQRHLTPNRQGREKVTRLFEIWKDHKVRTYES